jgi:Mn2+/Fe2+ NRAMP family transporter
MDMRHATMLFVVAMLVAACGTTIRPPLIPAAEAAGALLPSSSSSPAMKIALVVIGLLVGYIGGLVMPNPLNLARTACAHLPLSGF